MYLAAGSVAVIYLSQLLEIVSYAFYSGAAPYYANESGFAPGYLSGAQAMMTSCTMIWGCAWQSDTERIYAASGFSSMILLCIGYAAAGTLIISSSLNMNAKREQLPESLASSLSI